MTTPTLQPVLRDIARHLEALQQTLQDEFNALSSQDMAAIAQAAQHKTRLTQLLDDLERERASVLRAAGLDLNSAGITAYLNRYTTPHHQNELAQLWQQIEQLTRDCERQNQINGLIIEQSRRRIKNALTILHGQLPGNELYSATGSTVAETQHQSLTTKA